MVEVEEEGSNFKYIYVSISSIIFVYNVFVLNFFKQTVLLSNSKCVPFYIYVA